MVKRASSNPEIRATEAKLEALRGELAEVEHGGGVRRVPKTRKMSKPKLSPKRITELEREKKFVAGQGEDQIKQYEATEGKNLAMDEEEDLEELTDGELEEVEKKKSWEIWLEKAFGGGEGTDVTQQKEGDTTSDITQMNLTNAPKRVKGHFANTRDEKPAITGTTQHKTTQTGRSTSNYLKPENVKNLPKNIELKYLKNPEQEHRGAGSTRIVPKTQKELDEDFFNQEADKYKKGRKKAWESWLEKNENFDDPHSDQNQIARIDDNAEDDSEDENEYISGFEKESNRLQYAKDIRNIKPYNYGTYEPKGVKPLKKLKAWESWLDKKNKVPTKIRPESPNKENNYQTQLDKPIQWRALKDKSWENWLELRKDQGQGDARYGNPHETGFEDIRVLQTSKDDFSLENTEEDKESNKPYIERKHEKDE